MLSFRSVSVALLGTVLVSCGGSDDLPPASCIVVGGATAPMPLFVPPDPPVPLAQVSGASPFATGCGREAVCGTVYVGSEVEPFVSVNPLDAGNLVGVWQQDRWSNGGAQGLLAAFSTDGGQTWSARQAPFSRCSGGNAVNGGDYARATDPWVSFGADGSVYWMAMVITDLPSGEEISAMRVSRSTDGGDTWAAPITLIQDTNPYSNDKNSIAADPTDPLYVYAVWDRLDAATVTGPAYFARTTDGGDTWEEARSIYDPGTQAQTVGNQIVVLSDGTLLNLFTEIQYGTATTPDSATLRVIHSADKGATWQAPVRVSDIFPRGAYDPENGTFIRDGSILGAIAVGPDDSVWVAWQDSRFSNLICNFPPCYGPFDGIALVSSTDGGQTWSSPARVNGDGSAQAFTPAVRVAADGTIGVSYYDLRDNTSDPDTLLASHWLATSSDGASWSERLVTGPFDLAIAPNALGLFLGDYMGLTSAGDTFVPFFAQTNPDLANRTNIYAVSLPSVAVTAKATPYQFEARAAQPIVPKGEWARLVGENIRRQRHHFPDRIRPDLPAALLR